MGFSYIRSSNPNCKEISLLYDKMPTIALFHWSQQDETNKKTYLMWDRSKLSLLMILQTEENIFMEIFCWLPKFLRFVLSITSCKSNICFHKAEIDSEFFFRIILHLFLLEETGKFSPFMKGSLKRVWQTVQ